MPENKVLNKRADKHHDSLQARRSPVVIGLGGPSDAGTEGGVADVLFKVGDTLTVRSHMSCWMESNGRRATIPSGQRITILEQLAGYDDVRFSAAHEGHWVEFAASPVIIEQHCAPKKATITKPERATIVPNVGDGLTVKSEMPCRREAFGKRHATIPSGEEIVIENPPPASKEVHFSIMREGQQHVFRTSTSTIDQCCGKQKPTAPKPEQHAENGR
jgi:hypothetical protein